MKNGCINKTVSPISPLILLILIGFPLANYAAEKIGVVIAAIGQVTTSGHALTRGSAIYTGNVINTAAKSKVSFKFTDGSVVTLKENSSYTVSNYAYNKGKAPDTFKAKLLKGGLKTITGAIGKEAQHTENAKAAGIPENKQVKVSHYETQAAVATIGVRGTDYECEINDTEAKVAIAVLDGTIDTSFADHTEMLGEGADASFIEIYFDGDYSLLSYDPIPSADFAMPVEGERRNQPASSESSNGEPKPAAPTAAGGASTESNPAAGSSSGVGSTAAEGRTSGSESEGGSSAAFKSSAAAGEGGGAGVGSEAPSEGNVPSEAAAATTPEGNPAENTGTENTGTENTGVSEAEAITAATDPNVEEGDI